MSSRLVDVAQTALSAISATQQHDADDFVSGVTRSFNATRSRRARRPRGTLMLRSVVVVVTVSSNSQLVIIVRFTFLLIFTTHNLRKYRNYEHYRMHNIRFSVCGL